MLSLSPSALHLFYPSAFKHHPHSAAGTLGLVGHTYQLGQNYGSFRVRYLRHVPDGQLEREEL